MSSPTACEHEASFGDDNTDYSSPAFLFRELTILGLLVLLSDLTLYRAKGFAGPAVFFLAAPLLIWMGIAGQRRRDISQWVLGGMLTLLSIRLVWCGSFLAVGTGLALVCCFAMAVSGMRPYVTQAVVFASKLIAYGYRGLQHYFRWASRWSPTFLKANWFAVALPAAMLMIFSAIFVLANPDLVRSLSESLSQFIDRFDRWLMELDAVEFLFCGFTAWIATGLLRSELTQIPEPPRSTVIPGSPSPFFDAYRNTLTVVIVLFAIYLVFEFQTLWLRTFPVGFHYSGYAHQGAAWLTVALALATLLLSLIFRGTVLADPRLGQLRTLSWIWSTENLLLALAVFNRLFIYVGFNGMTRMRVIGFLGVTSVVVGFILVLIKIRRNENFTWLIRRQLWTVAIAAYVYVVFPVDAYVNQFNVARILAGDPRPSVQISHHPTSNEGWLCLAPLIDCNDQIIRNGIRGMLDQKLAELEQSRSAPGQQNWSARQLATDRLHAQLSGLQSKWSNDPWRKISNTELRFQIINTFSNYSYQWY
jgi:hypothetical protein